MMKKFILLICTVLSAALIFAQEVLDPVNGIHDSKQIHHAFINAHLVIAPGMEYQNATLLTLNGKVVSFGNGISVPKDAIVHDLNGKYIYPAFFEINSSFGMPKIAPALTNSHWNDAIHSDFIPSTAFHYDEKEAKSLRQKGVGVVMTHCDDGIAQGSGMVVPLKPEKNINPAQKAMFYSMSKGSSKTQYPTSYMGAVALMRQTFYDSKWLCNQNQQGETDSYNAVVAEYNHWNLPKVVQTNTTDRALGLLSVGREFNQDWVIVGAGKEYERADEFRYQNAKVVLPLNFPKAYDMSDIYRSSFVTTEQLKHWELAPYNPAILHNNQVQLAITTENTSSKDFWTNLRLAVKNGLPQEAALRALTLTPAEWMNVADEYGSLEAGKQANFFIAEDNIFTSKAKIEESWVGTDRMVFDRYDEHDITGEYELNFKDEIHKLLVSRKGNKFVGKLYLHEGSQSIDVKFDLNLNLVTFYYSEIKEGEPEFTRFTGKVNFKSKIWDGWAANNTEKFQWTAIRHDFTKTKFKTFTADTNIPGVWYPNMAYGRTESIQKRKNYFIENAIIWSNGPLGKFKGSLLIEDGIIVAVGKDLVWDGKATKIDAKGMHLTPGIVDEHSHIAAKGGINESGQAVSAEVRIADALNSKDINIYRQLSGGVTTAQILHGSANPIGGQSAIIKLKWGETPEQMYIDDQVPFIKFALGENVKQSWRSYMGKRYPQSRMGVEQLFYDAFYQAKMYDSAHTEHASSTSWQNLPVVNVFTNPEQNAPRVDLELEALSQILNHERYITCHSYVQSEMLMLMTVADSLNLALGTFTHGLEAYKIADEIAADSIAVSTFADWWAYKFEVKDGIPYNAAILQNKGVLVGINSDDAEMGRRLNQEAAKAVKYGGVTEEEALKMVTLNPAKMLHLDNKIGSIEIGKQADIVLWTAHPLSLQAKVNTTMIEGTIYFSQLQNTLLIEQNQAERKRLINKMMSAVKGGAPTQPIKPQLPYRYECETEVKHYMHE